MPRRLYPFPRHYRLTRTDEFSSVFGFRRAIRGQLLMLHYLPQTDAGGKARLGLVIGKKFVRGAVGRNRIKRQIRERFRLQHDRLQGHDLIVRVIARAERVDRQQIAAEIDRLFAKLRPRVAPTSGETVR